MNGARSSTRSDPVNPPLVLVGVPGSKRFGLVVDAAREAGFARIEIRTWKDIAEDRPLPTGAVVRIESPSECQETLRLILRAGIEPLASLGGEPLSADGIECRAPDRGEIIRPRQWFLGLRALLTKLAAQSDPFGIRWMSAPEAIITAFDKLACLERWEAAKLPVPERFGPISSYDQLRRAVPDSHARLFVKLRYGYSAMGAVALEWRGPLVRALTTVDTDWSHGTPRLFLTKRPKTLLRESEIAWLIDKLATEELVVERWLPKDRWNGKCYDLRLVIIDGRVRHVVGRASATPFTNLNLNADRIAREELVERFGPRWQDLTTLAQAATECLPGAGMLGLDVLVTPRQRAFVLLEANAFGDYLPGLIHEGETPYSAQFRRRLGVPA
jgi:hypothetical protein